LLQSEVLVLVDTLGAAPGVVLAVDAPELAEEVVEVVPSGDSAATVTVLPLPGPSAVSEAVA
jgi:hypothetical protein